MAILERVSLAGVRRFGRETTIEFSPHATILLAPNGTGKTTVFEAIELALTGVISRLQGEGELKAVVGETSTGASIKVGFDTALAEVSITKQGVLTLSGDVSGIFPGVTHDDIPYLLRLTHLLDQRERSWFIQANPRDAGFSLSKLPVGREGAIASAALVPIRKSVTERIKTNIASTSSVITQLQEWETLIAERDKAASATNTSLKPLETIYQELAELAMLMGMEETLAPDWRGEGGKVQALIAFHATLNSKLSARQSRLTEKTELLAALVGTLQPYQADRQRLHEDLSRIAELRAAIEKRQAELSICASDKEAAELERMLFEKRSIALQAEVSLIRSLSLAREVLNAARAQSVSDVAAVQAAEQELATVRAEVSKLAGDEEELARTSHQVSSLISLEANLARASKLAEKWRDEIAEAARLSSAVAAERDEVARLAESHAGAVRAYASASLNHKEASARHAAASASVGELRRALSLIVAYLPVDRADCPACGVHHGAEELQRRLQRSLETDDSAMQLAEVELKFASEEVAKQQAIVGATLHALQTARSRLDDMDDRLSELHSNADAYARTEYLTGWSTPDLAVDAISERLNRARTELASQRDLIDQINSRIDATKSLELRSLLSATQTRVEGLRSQARASRDSIDSATVELARFQQGASDRSILELEEKRVALDESVEFQVSRIEGIDREIAEKDRSIHSLIVELSKIEVKVGETQSRVAVLDSRWRNLSLPGSPSSDVIAATIENAEADLKDVERNLERINALSGGLDARLVAEQQNSIQEIIDQRRGAMVEDAFGASLRAKKGSFDVEAQELAKLSAALEALSRKLATEIENVHDYIATVVPSWQVLLKRIVREPRFASTTLGLQNHYRRPVASVSVKVNGQEIAAPLIASEAQMTDLQLTFLLSMALNHKWSSWRALLLDDPTQHHDLVHASSVFDVLRDYIVDHGFQVILATHDAAQARYFKRKLLNDGVDARIWSLVPEDGGVVAQETK